jgi:dGTPase
MKVYINNYDQIMEGCFDGSLIKKISPTPSEAMKKVIAVSVSRIYSDPSVIEIELAGYKIISTLMDAFTDAALSDHTFGRKLMKLFPDQYQNPSNRQLFKSSNSNRLCFRHDRCVCARIVPKDHWH